MRGDSIGDAGAAALAEVPASREDAFVQALSAFVNGWQMLTAQWKRAVWESFVSTRPEFGAVDPFETNDKENR